MRDDETKHRFLELRAEGYSYDKIAKELGVSKQTLIGWSQQFKNEITNLRAIALETFQEEYCISKEKRIELFDKKLRTIIEELEKRDLSVIPTEKLFELTLKYATALKAEASPIIFTRGETPADMGFGVSNWVG